MKRLAFPCSKLIHATVLRATVYKNQAKLELLYTISTFFKIGICYTSGRTATTKYEVTRKEDNEENHTRKLNRKNLKIKGADSRFRSLVKRKHSKGKDFYSLAA